MRRQAFTFWHAAGLLALVVIIAAILLPVFGRARIGDRKHSCQSNLKQIGLGIRQYLQDYDEKFPLVSVGREGWADLLQPYLKTRWIFRCPYPEDEPGATSDYFYNARLAGLVEAKIYSQSTYTGESPIIMLGDGVLQAGTNANITELPFEWLRNTDAPARRHFDGANYAFIDGHVKFFKPELVLSNRPAKEGQATFLAE